MVILLYRLLTIYFSIISKHGQLIDRLLRDNYQEVPKHNNL